jgi:hypothetical protein
MKELEDKNNLIINRLLAFAQPIPRAPPTTQVKVVDPHTTIIQEEGKTIRFKLDNRQKRDRNTVWSRKKAKRMHSDLRMDAKELIIKERQKRREERKREKKRVGSSVPSIVMDSAATSTVIKESDTAYVDVLDENSPKTFYNANGTKSKAGKKAVLQYNLRKPATDADMVPSLSMNSLLSTSKLADANYITIFTKDEVKVIDGETSSLNIKGDVVMQGWRCPMTKLWRVPLTNKMSNINMDTALLSKTATELILKKRPHSEQDMVNSVYELPSTEQVIAWYHAAAGYPTKSTWIKAIDAGFFATWPMLTSKQ